MELSERIQAFLAAGPYAVAGASTERSKYGNKVLRCYLQRGKRPVYPLHPRAAELGTIEGERAYASLDEVPDRVRAMSIITPPRVTEEIVLAAARRGVRFLWMQPGAESPAAVARGAELGLELIHGGPCLLVVLGYRE